MNFFMMLAAMQGAVDLTPQLNSVSVVSTQSGACSGSVASPAAAINVAWASDNFDPEVHEYKLYENDVLKLSTTDASWQKVIAGNVEDGPFQQWTSDWTYRVDIVNAGNGVVLASRESSPWRQLYGSCRDMGDPL